MSWALFFPVKSKEEKLAPGVELYEDKEGLWWLRHRDVCSACSCRCMEWLEQTQNYDPARPLKIKWKTPGALYADQFVVWPAADPSGCR
jgi:hypothetical protein